jgi:hypothetical protein
MSRPDGRRARPRQQSSWQQEKGQIVTKIDPKPSNTSKSGTATETGTRGIVTVVTALAWPRIFRSAEFCSSLPSPSRSAHRWLKD